MKVANELHAVCDEGRECVRFIRVLHKIKMSISVQYVLSEQMHIADSCVCARYANKLSETQHLHVQS